MLITKLMFLFQVKNYNYYTISHRTKRSARLPPDLYYSFNIDDVNYISSANDSLTHELAK